MSGDRPAAGRPHMRWWMWVALAIAVLVASAAAVRMHGAATLAEVETTLVSRGLPDLEDFLACAPPADAGRQARLARLMLSQGDWGVNPPGLPFRELRELRHDAGYRGRLEAYLVAGQPAIRELESILDDGHISLGLTSWLPRNADAIRYMSPQDIWQQHSSLALASTRAWMNWYGIQACIADDPEPFLRRIDSISDGLQTPGCVLDAMVSIACGSIRDQIHLWLATRGRLADPRLRSWVEETSPHVTWLGQGLAGERLFGAAQCRYLGWNDLCIAVDPVTAAHVAPSWQGRLLGTATWLLLDHETAVGVDAIAVLEEHLTGMPIRTAIGMPFRLDSRLGSQYGYSDEILVTAYEAAYAQRMNRLAAACAAVHRSGRSLPTDHATLAAMTPPGLLTTRTPDEPAIRYEYLGGARIRCGLDPSAAKPPVVPASRWLTATAGGVSGYGTGIGTPAMQAPYVWMRWSLEIDLDAILVPPPEKPVRKP